MDRNIVNKYHVKFDNTDFSGSYDIRQIYKTVKTNNDFLSEFLMDWYIAENIDRLLLPSIYQVLNGEEEEVDSGSEIINILIMKDVVEFSPRDEPDFSIPTQDFKELVEGWRDFLKVPPLHGSKL